MTDVQQFVQKVLDFLDANPELAHLKAKIFAWVLNLLNPIPAGNPNDWETLCKEGGEGRDWEFMINLVNRPTPAHARTMLGGVDDLLNQYKNQTLPTLQLIQEADTTKEEEPCPVASVEPKQDTKSIDPIQSSKPEPQTKRRR